MKGIFCIQFLITVFLYSVSLKVIPFVNEDEGFKDCTENGKAIAIDVSQLNLYNKDNELYIDGSILFNSNIDRPFNMTMNVEQYKYNQWITSFLNRYIPDFCLQMKSKHEPWYPATKNFHDCPIQAGTVETIDKLASADFIKNIPDMYEGKGRFTIKYDIQNGTKVLKECYQLYFELIKV